MTRPNTTAAGRIAAAALPRIRIRCRPEKCRHSRASAKHPRTLGRLLPRSRNSAANRLCVSFLAEAAQLRHHPVQLKVHRAGRCRVGGRVRASVRNCSLVGASDTGIGYCADVVMERAPDLAGHDRPERAGKPDKREAAMIGLVGLAQIQRPTSMRHTAESPSDASFEPFMPHLDLPFSKPSGRLDYAAWHKTSRTTSLRQMPRSAQGTALPTARLNGLACAVLPVTLDRTRRQAIQIPGQRHRPAGIGGRRPSA